MKKTNLNKPLDQHNQFIEDEAVSRDNQLEKKIKAAYCGNLQLRRFTTLILQNPMDSLRQWQIIYLNVMELNQMQTFDCTKLCNPQYHRICKPNQIWLRTRVHKLNHCKRWSVHPFQEYFWKDGITNLNRLSYSWNNEKHEWVQLYPTNYLTTLKLTNTKHKAFETNEFEQLNVLNELVKRIHEENADSLSSLVLNTRSKTRFWNLSSWTFTLKSLFLIVSGIFLFVNRPLCFYILYSFTHTTPPIGCHQFFY